MEIIDVKLEILCHQNRNHLLGVVVLNTRPHARAGGYRLATGLRWDEFGKAVADCIECGLTGAGKDQRVSRKRIEARLQELVDEGSHTGKLQV